MKEAGGCPDNASRGRTVGWCDPRGPAGSGSDKAWCGVVGGDTVRPAVGFCQFECRRVP